MVGTTEQVVQLVGFWEHSKGEMLLQRVKVQVWVPATPLTIQVWRLRREHGAEG